MYKHTTSRPGGYAVSESMDGKVTEHDTKTCCHCGGVFTIVKGSGRIRGFCRHCMNMTCGSPCCDEHFPIEERFDLFEKGLLKNLMDPRASVLAQINKIILP